MTKAVSSSFDHEGVGDGIKPTARSAARRKQASGHRWARKRVSWSAAHSIDDTASDVLHATEPEKVESVLAGQVREGQQGAHV